MILPWSWRTEFIDCKSYSVVAICKLGNSHNNYFFNANGRGISTHTMDMVSIFVISMTVSGTSWIIDVLTLHANVSDMLMHVRYL
jgi:hypothetical protein